MSALTYVEKNKDYLEAFERYPLLMTHPHFKPAKIDTTPSGDRVGLAAQFAPVQVGSPDEEAYYEAQGYVAGNKGGDPSAWMAEMTRAHNGGEPANYVPQEYPKWVAGRIVNSAEEEAEANAALQVDAAKIVDRPVSTEELEGRGGSTEALMAELEQLRARNAELELLKDKRTAKRA